MRVLGIIASIMLFCIGSAAIADDKEANALFVEAVKSFKSISDDTPPLKKLEKIELSIEKLNEISEKFPSSDLAVKLITGQAIGDISLSIIQAERDKVLPEVEAVIAQQKEIAAQEEALVRHQVWVDETLECIKDKNCFRDLSFQIEMAGRDINEMPAEQLELYKRFSFMPVRAAYDGLSGKLMADFADFEAMNPGGLYTYPPFHQALSFAILHEDPEDVFEVRQKYGKPERPPQFADPMQIAAFARNFEKAEEYRARFESWVGEDEYYTSDRVFEMQLYYELTVDEIRQAAHSFEKSNELHEFAPWEVLLYLADHNSEKYLSAFEQYNPEEYGFGYLAFSKIIYHALQGDPEEGVAFYLSQKANMEEVGEDYQFIALLGLYELALITIDQDLGSGDGAIEVLLREVLDLYGEEILNPSYTGALAVVSAALL